jgi:hypothetical protein
MSGRRSAFSGRSAAQWGIRGVVALAAAAMGIASVSDTLANVAVKVDPMRAHELSLANGHITAAAAEQKFVVDPIDAPDSEASKLARLALRQDATAVGALSVLGLQAQASGDISRARELFSYSHRLSRRELRTQIWAIEEHVARGDISGALEQYDMALRTSRKARDLLFPVLARAIAEPAVRESVLDTLADESSWAGAFTRYVAANAPEPLAVIALFQEGARVGLPIEPADRARLVNALVARGLIDEAWRFYETFRRDADRRHSRDARFFLAADVPAVFDWTLVNSNGLSAAVQRGDGEGIVHFGAASGFAGIVLRQMQLLPPGTYRLEGRSRDIDQPEHSRPYWRLTCNDGRDLGRVLLPNSPGEWRNFEGSFTVPASCVSQVLSLVVRASDSIRGVEGQVASVQLIPAS